MKKSDVGRGRTPKHSRFKPGLSGNPKGRPKRTVTTIGEITNDVFKTSVNYSGDGRPKKATRHELSLKTLVKHALTGDIGAAEMLLKLRLQTPTGEVGIRRIVVSNWLPDYPGQTGEQRSRQHLNEADYDSLGGQEQSGANPARNKP
jgi:hypothetical protein